MLTGRLYLALFLVSFALTEIVFISSCGHAQRGRRGEAIGKPPELEVKLIMYKNEYLVREPIWVKIQVKNIGKEAGKFHFVTLDGLVIEDSKGKIYPCNITWDYSPINIEPNQTLENEFEVLLAGYGLPEDSFHVRWYLPAEVYNIFYNLGKDEKSETLSFVILEPKGKELESMNILKESHNLFIEKKYNKCITKLNQIIQEYSQSNYAPYALFQKVSLYKIGAIPDLDKTIDSYYQMLDTYPNSREAVQVLSYLAHYYRTKPDIPGLTDYLINSIDKHPDTEVAREAQKELAKIKE
jgi:hypothetical protein